MSADKKPGRFSTLEAIRKPQTTPEPEPDLTPALKARTTDDDKPEPFSSHLKPGTKRRLKQAAAREGRKQFEALEQAIVEYLNKYHPDIRE
ncbi:hypothetical protein [Deinococcus metallilatus]|uniref:Uncharacterized protein YkwD n=1 Tax=Deinococcus metallilatus TaxID=1211322 RepID=A0AAJ5F1K0_9DEIO|nr:hypothetical protein [Deinococcus metallilatus]MBB5297183.1 uncharacterized protein YkwD [Deinococcus metallilatus]RXJ17323.1 hypothetical protein ERJ73_01940 [Deinococcus metallilatus]TLK21792.1 hypothetical protein FCS05_18585 [Deinococcus metallilatus]GMA17251.1 hypothetical protein GCM10025871_35820 [Deinococcus metallilatus]